MVAPALIFLVFNGSDIERGTRNPTIDVVEKLAAPLGVTAAELLN